MLPHDMAIIYYSFFDNRGDRFSSYKQQYILKIRSYTLENKQIPHQYVENVKHSLDKSILMLPSITNEEHASPQYFENWV